MKIRKNVHLLFLLLVSISVEQCDDGISDPKSFWETLAGEWHLGTTYIINREEFSVPPCDRSTIIRFNAMKENVLKSSLPTGVSIHLDTFVYVDNEYSSCSINYLFWGTVLGKKAPLPHTADLHVTFIKNCYNCRYSDVQFIDIDACKTDSLPFSILKLEEDDIQVQMVSNVYNRQINNQPVLDTIVLSLVRSKPYDNIDVGPFDINSYGKINWLRFETDPSGVSGNVSLAADGVDGSCLYFDDFSSAAPISNDLKSAMGADKKMTLSFWVKPSATGRPVQILYSKYANSYGPFLLSLEYNKFAIAVNDGFGNMQKVVSNNSVSNGSWNHVCLSYRDRELLLYINGVTDTKTTIQDWLYDANANTFLGNSAYALSNGEEKGFKGCLDEMIFFEGYLSQGEVFQLYQWHLNN